MYYVYALKFSNGRMYVGMTSDINQRILDHKRGHTKSTKNRGEFNVIILEKCSNRKEARLREKYWKSGCGKEKIKNKGA